jgi:hypothetical protein
MIPPPPILEGATMNELSLSAGEQADLERLEAVIGAGLQTLGRTRQRYVKFRDVSRKPL